MKRVLILGGGVAGCACAHFLKNKYKVDILEKNMLGGLSRTHEYSGHPYEMGPHIWFYPDRNHPVNQLLIELTDNNLYEIKRDLRSWVHSESKAYRYPIHYEDVKSNPFMMSGLTQNRDENLKLLPGGPEIGKCTMEEYFKYALGGEIFGKLMEHYNHKMWGIHPSEMGTNLVFADQMKEVYSGKREKWDPLKKEDTTMGEGNFQVYPSGGWNKVWLQMAAGAYVYPERFINLRDGKIISFDCYNDDSGWHHSVERNIADYEFIINTLCVDTLNGPCQHLPYMGRILIPIILPVHTSFLDSTVSHGIESYYYPGPEPQTRVTFFDRITHYSDVHSLVTIEVPIWNGGIQYMPDNVREYGEKYNLLVRKAYPIYTEEAKNIYHASKDLWDRQAGSDQLFHCGRLAQYKYMGMAETVLQAMNLTKDM